MCGRFTLAKSTKEISQRRRVGKIQVEVKPRYNRAPIQSVLIVTDDGQRQLVQMCWGLIPSWADYPVIGNKMINARAETVAEKPSFRTSLTKRRCLVLADGFYQWQQRGTIKQPVHIVLKSREPFGFAGLWEEWLSPRGDKIQSCTIVTTSANELLIPFRVWDCAISVAAVYDRRPFISRKISAVIDRRYSAKANFKWYETRARSNAADPYVGLPTL